MKAIVLQELGGPDRVRLDERPQPEAGPGEVVVRLKAAALNHRDVWITKGQYAQIQLPTVLGSDGAGEVAAVGAGVDPGLLGQAVIVNPSLDWGPDERVQGRSFRILGMPDDGTFAEYVKLPAVNVGPKPAHLNFEEAAALPLAGLTAYRAVAVRAQVRAGETVLVTGIGGGVASFALAFAQALGAKVAVTSGSEAKLARAKAAGAVAGVNHRSEDWGKTLIDALGTRPDVVIDGAGGSTYARAVDILKPAGRLVSYGATIGNPEAVDIRRVFWNQLNLLGSTMGSPADFAGMLDLVARHQLRPQIDRVFALDQAADALQRMDAGEQDGKIILRIS